MKAHIEIGSTPWCEWTGCAAGMIVAEAAGVHLCGFETVKEAEEAARKLRPHFKRGRVKVVRGECPIAKSVLGKAQS
jgi:hypothetical protein